MYYLIFSLWIHAFKKSNSFSIIVVEISKGAKKKQCMYTYIHKEKEMISQSVYTFILKLFYKVLYS